MTVGAWVWPRVIRGITDASTTRSPSRPRTRSWQSTTAASSLPMRQVPTGWNAVWACSRMNVASCASSSTLPEPGGHGRADVRAQRCGIEYLLGDAQPDDEVAQVRLGGEVARVDDRRLRRVVTGEADVAVAVGLKQLHPQRQTVAGWGGQAASSMPSSGTGSQTNSRSGAASVGLLRTNATASLMLEVSIPRRASRKRASWAGSRRRRG